MFLMLKWVKEFKGREAREARKVVKINDNILNDGWIERGWL